MIEFGSYFTAELAAAFLTLSLLEIVLGIDNIIFLSITAAKLPLAQQPRARTIGLAGAMVTRIALLVSLAWLARLTATWVTIFGEELSGRDFILLLGGAFLIVKSGLEIRGDLAGGGKQATVGRKVASFWGAIVQIMVLDIVFSLDSVITAVGMTRNLPVMIAAIVTAVIVMMVFSGPVARFVEERPTVRILALAFLVLIGMSLISESLDFHVPKAYLYFAMAFSTVVELINLRIRKQTAPPANQTGNSPEEQRR